MSFSRHGKMCIRDRYGLDVELDRPITEIAVGAQQRVEILKTLYRGAELLILDEPTAALTDIEVEGLFKIIRKLTEEEMCIRDRDQTPPLEIHSLILPYGQK